jgi:anti-sigma factor ChrR (cupin superfamily)
MIRGKEELPESWRDAVEDDPRPLELAGVLPEVLGRAARPAAGLDRLLGAVSQLPLRYAPFLDRVAALWDVSEQEVSAAFTRANSLAGWKRTPLPGVRVIDVAGGPRASGGETFLVRFAPGTRFPKHRHPGHEALLVLEGSYTDTLGRLVQPGDLHEMQPGSEHGFLVARDGPCVGAALQHGREFTGLLLRLVARVLDK